MSKSQNLSWNDAQFCGLRAQTNVYSLSKLTSKHDKTKLFAASIDGHLASFEFESQSSYEKLLPNTQDIILFDTALGSSNHDNEEETEIVSVDAVYNWDRHGGSALALTYLKLGAYEEDKAPQAFMNIYQLSTTSNFEASESLLQELSLDFTPFILSHHQMCLENGKNETFLLLSGNDHKIHTYQPMADYKGYEEIDSSQLFPEFSDISDNVTQLEMKQIDEIYRLTCYGTQSGLICLSLVNTESKEILNSWTTEMDSPITSLNLFNQYTKIQCPDFLEHKEPQKSEKESQEQEEALYLVATSAIDPSVVYCDVMANGLSKSRVLPVSNSQDVVLCSCVMDVDFDGQNEILLGTYGQVLLAYKLINEKPQVYTSTPFDTPMPVPIHTNMPIHTDTPILSSEIDKYSKSEVVETQEKDVRRRHKTVAASASCSENDRFKCEEGSHFDGISNPVLLSRSFRSQENLVSPSVRSIHFDTPERLLTPDLTIPHFAMSTVTDYPCYKLVWTRRFCNPVMGLMCEDVVGDGMNDLVVLTLKGLHILQPDLHEVASVILNRLRAMCNSDNVHVKFK